MQSLTLGLPILQNSELNKLHKLPSLWYSVTALNKLRQDPIQNWFKLWSK
jgi:hypothetical protein